MLRISRKPLLVVATLIFIAGIGIAAAYIFATSNVVHVDMQYAVALGPSVTDTNITLTATVTNGAAPVRAGIIVDFYYSIDGGTTWTYFATQPTDASGVSSVTYSATANGGYDFRAVATIP